MDKVKTESKKELPTVKIFAKQSACTHVRADRLLDAYRRKDGEYIVICPFCKERVCFSTSRKIENIARTDNAIFEAAAVKLADCGSELDTDLNKLINLLDELLLKFPKTENDEINPIDIDFDVENMTKSKLIEYFITMIFGVKLLAFKCDCIEKHIEFLSKLRMKLYHQLRKELRKEREEAERLRKEREAEEAARLEREHEELIQLRKEVAELRKSK